MPGFEERLPVLPSRHRLLCALLALAGGYWAGSDLFWGPLLVVVGVGGVWLSLRYPGARVAAALALATLAGAGLYDATRPAPSPPSPTLDAPVARWRGRLTEDPRQGPRGLRLVVDLEARHDRGGDTWQPEKGRVVLWVEGHPEPAPAWGDQVFFLARLSPATGFRNPGNEGYQAYLKREQISARASARWPGEVVFAAPEERNPFWVLWRRRVSEAIGQSAPGQSGGILRALALGDRSGLSQSTVETFRHTGTSHVLAISGLHLGILLLLVYPALRAVLVRIPGLALRCPVVLLARAGTLPALALYAALSGFQTSTVRALVMAALLLAAGALSRRLSPSSLLASTALIMALPSPGVLAAPGFQLSLAALAGLFWLAPALEERFTLERDPLDALASPSPAPGRIRAVAVHLLRLFLISACAAATTLPLAVFHFGHASTLGAVCSPPAIVTLGFLCLPLTLLGALAHPASPFLAESLWSAAGVVAEKALSLLSWMEPHAAPLDPQVLGSPAGVIGAFALLTALLLALRDRRVLLRNAAPALAGLGLLLVPGFARHLQARWSDEVHLWVFDVGQGQSVALQLPGNRWVLVDGGGFPGSSFDVGDRVVAPALRALGAESLWLVISTHPHPDHALGLPALIRWGSPQEVWLPGSFHGDARYREILQAARESGARAVWIAEQYRERRVDDVTIAIHQVPGRTENDRSLVVYLRNAETAAVIAADVETHGQRLLLEKGFPSDCRLLVAPHHGAASGLYPPFLEHLHPETVFVSAGGRPGLPAEEFLEAVRQRGGAAHSTHRSGALHATLGPASHRTSFHPLWK